MTAADADAMTAADANCNVQFTPPHKILETTVLGVMAQGMSAPAGSLGSPRGCSSAECRGRLPRRSSGAAGTDDARAARLGSPGRPPDMRRARPPACGGVRGGACGGTPAGVCGGVSGGAKGSGVDAARRRPNSPEASPAAKPVDSPEAGGGSEGAGEGPLPPPGAAPPSRAAWLSPGGCALLPAEPASSRASNPAELAAIAKPSSGLLCAPLLPRSSGTPAQPRLNAAHLGIDCMSCAHSCIQCGT